MDEIWSFVYAKAANVEKAKAAPENAGDVWTWTAIDADTKLIVSWLVASRDRDSALYFIHGVSLSLRGSGRLDTRLDTPPISLRHHPGSGLAQVLVLWASEPCRFDFAIPSRSEA